MPVFSAIAVLAVLIVVHELGHFLAARLQKIHVTRFSIGFGPILWKYQGPETEYALRGFPLGGFVGFPDDDPDSEIPPSDPNLLRNRPILDRAIVISAGVIANLIFAYFLLVAHVSIAGIQEVNYKPGILVPAVASEVSSAAAKAGIKAGDLIIAIDGQPLEASENAVRQLMKTIQNHPSQPIKLEVQRQGEKLNLTVIPEPGIDGKGHIGVQLGHNRDIIHHRTKNIFQAFSAGGEQFEKIVILTLDGFWQLIHNFSETSQQIAGPVKIVEQGAKIAQADASNLLWFAALISINLAILNILPLPALDGGQLAFLLIEALRGKPLPTHIQDGVMQTGLMLLLGLGIFLIIRDTSQLEVIQKILPQQ